MSYIASCSSPTPGLRHRAIASVQVPAPRGSVRTPVTLASAMSSAPSTQTGPCLGLRAHPTGPAGTGTPSAARPHPAPVQTPTGSHRDPSGPARAHVRNGRKLDRCPTPPSPTTPWGLLTTNVQTTRPCLAAIRPVNCVCNCICQQTSVKTLVIIRITADDTLHKQDSRFFFTAQRPAIFTALSPEQIANFMRNEGESRTGSEKCPYRIGRRELN